MLHVSFPETSANFYWHVELANGFYCIYCKRDGRDASSCGLPDCPNTGTLTPHANMLVEAGMSFVVADLTSFFMTGGDADCFQRRPWEVLAEEWLVLRGAGVQMPKIAIWQHLANPEGDLLQQYVTGGSAYAGPAYDDLILRDEFTGQKAFLTTTEPDPTVVGKLMGLNYSAVDV